MDKNAEELVKLYIARADYHRRTFEAVVEKGIDPPEGLLDLTQVLPEGIEKIRKGTRLFLAIRANSQGHVAVVKKTDSYYYQLEKYLTRFVRVVSLMHSQCSDLEQLERFERHEEVEPIWKKATEVRKTDYLSWLSFAEFEMSVLARAANNLLTAYIDGGTTSKERDRSFCKLSRVALTTRNTCSKLGLLSKVSMARWSSLRLL